MVEALLLHIFRQDAGVCNEARNADTYVLVDFDELGLERRQVRRGPLDGGEHREI